MKRLLLGLMVALFLPVVCSAQGVMDVMPATFDIAPGVTVPTVSDAAVLQKIDTALIRFPWFLTSVPPGDYVNWKNTLTLTGGSIRWPVLSLIIFADLNNDDVPDSATYMYSATDGEMTSWNLISKLPTYGWKELEITWMSGGEYTGEITLLGEYYFGFFGAEGDINANGKFDFVCDKDQLPTLVCDMHCGMGPTGIVGCYSENLDTMVMWEWKVYEGINPEAVLESRWLVPIDVPEAMWGTWKIQATLIDQAYSYPEGVLLSQQSASFDVGYAAPNITFTVEIWMVIAAAATAGVSAVGYALTKLKP